MIKDYLCAFYEHPTLKPYRLNPCDVDAFPVLRPLGRALSAIGGLCPCCSGGRVLAAAALGAAFPTYTLVAAATILVALTIAETLWPTA